MYWGKDEIYHLKIYVVKIQKCKAHITVKEWKIRILSLNAVRWREHSPRVWRVSTLAACLSFFTHFHGLHERLLTRAARDLPETPCQLTWNRKQYINAACWYDFRYFLQCEARCFSPYKSWAYTVVKLQGNLRGPAQQAQSHVPLMPWQGSLFWGQAVRQTYSAKQCTLFLIKLKFCKNIKSSVVSMPHKFLCLKNASCSEEKVQF